MVLLNVFGDRNLLEKLQDTCPGAGGDVMCNKEAYKQVHGKCNGGEEKAGREAYDLNMW